MKKLPRHLFYACSLALLLACKPANAETAYKVLPRLEATSDTTRPLPIGWTSRSLLPWYGPDEAPAILVTGHKPYLSPRNLIYKAGPADTPAGLYATSPGFPVYEEGQPFDALPPGRYIPLTNASGAFDLIRTSDWTYHENTGKPSAPRFDKQYKIEFQGPVRKGESWVADLNGDDIPDVLVGESVDSNYVMYPGKGPWTGTENPDMGALPDTDIQNFRGYDIAGNWLGNPSLKYLWWAEGLQSDDGELSFGAFKPVRYGQTDYRVQWKCYDNAMAPVVMNFEGDPFIILFSDSNQAIALPVREETDGEFHTGKAIPFLQDGARISSANHPSVIGVGDLNRDGSDDLVIGAGANGRLTVLSGNAPGSFRDMGNIYCKGDPVAGDTLVVPVRVDWDRDGLPDLITGGASGEISFWKGTSNPLEYTSYQSFQTASGYIRHRPTGGNLQGDNEIAWSYIKPEVWDWDGDGNPDLITNDNEAKLFLYRGTGTGTLLNEKERFMLGNKPLPLAWRSRPAVIDGKYDLAGDDRPCLLYMNWDNRLVYGVPKTKGSLNFTEVVELHDDKEQPIILAGPAGHSGRAMFSVADWDEDGTWDVLIGCHQVLQKYFRAPEKQIKSSAVFWLRNIGTNNKPVFETPRLITFSDGSLITLESHAFNAFPSDLNNDGHLDLIIGESEGFCLYIYRSDLAWEK